MKDVSRKSKTKRNLWWFSYFSLPLLLLLLKWNFHNRVPDLRLEIEEIRNRIAYVFGADDI